MKIKVLTRSDADYMRDRKTDLQKVQKNAAPELHPFEKAREYTRALNHTKLERVFAKPFVGQLDGHADGVFCLAKHPSRLNCLISGACDGQIRVWNLSSQTARWSVDAHKGFVRGICVTPFGESYVSVGDDMLVKFWKLKLGESSLEEHATPEDFTTPYQTFSGKHIFTGISHHQRDKLFATSGSSVDIWDHHRSEPMQTMSWGVDTVTSVKFNPVECSVLASTGSDRSMALYDIRSATPIRKLVLEMRTNAIAWNPIEAFNFTMACEDHNAYTFDMRKLDVAMNVHKGHASAVMDIDYSPTGREFVTGSYDKSLRIFRYNEGVSRDIYYAKRMQRLFAVAWSADAKFVLCGSDETNVRVWKAEASEKLGVLVPRERAAMEYGEKLKERFKHHPEVKRISTYRNVPLPIRKAEREKKVMLNAIRRKDANVRAHTKPENLKPFKVERKRHIVKELQ